MVRFPFLIAVLVTFLAACAPPSGGVGTSDDGTRVYRINTRDTAEIQFRMLDSVNSLREARGLTQLELSSELNAAAATHSRDMAVQNRPWHFGSDGSSPIDRVRRVGFNGLLVGENISETYETELETLAAWMELRDTRDIILAREARTMGFAWFQEPAGKIWWTLIVGGDPGRSS
ncbi:CAP domain-containing protein [Aestuariibius sp. 2305UL40-4]|uniref:CAP domain-containing protein n=1 Tax=Aestuariibius violaceus TaxID=3234132 RepID=UPI00345E558A